MQPELQDTKAHLAIECLKPVGQYFEVGNYNAALTCFENALALDPNNHDAWNGRGIALCQLKIYGEGIASFDQALKIKPDDYIVWDNRGAALLDWEGFEEEAIASFDHALKIKPDDQEAWLGRGLAQYYLSRYEDAIASYDKTTQIKPDDHRAWINRGNAVGKSLNYNPQAPVILQRQFPTSPPVMPNPSLTRRGYEGELLCYQEGLKHCSQSADPQGWGILHQCMGNALYCQGCGKPNNRDYWLQALDEYNEAIKTLTAQAFPARHLELLQDLIKVYLALGDKKIALALRSEGSELLGRLLQDTHSKHRQLAIARQFASFDQLRVYELVQSGNWCAALELAEARKNLCLNWLRYGWSDAVKDSPKYTEIQQLLNPQTAAIYWHISPVAITTFILRHNQPPQVHSTLVTGDDGTYPTATRQLHDFENWVKAWKENYQDYRAGREKGTEEKLAIAEDKKPARKDHPWRHKMTTKLEELKNILNISEILPHLSDIDHLILIPHRDLHLLPLHYLFPENLTITYLPSAQIGLSLQLKPNPVRAIHQLPLLSVEHPETKKRVHPDKALDLLFAEIESAVISQPNPNPTRIAGRNADKERVIDALKSAANLFHFTGHGYHDVEEPLKSALALAGEDVLTLHDIFELKSLDYYLVCLSACETGITSKQGLIDEFVGLVSGFLAVGATHVVSTLWTVDEISTALIMIRFYQLLKDMAPAQALKQAQNSLRTLTYPQLAQWYLELAPTFADSDLRCWLTLQSLSQIAQEQADEKGMNFCPYEHPYYWAGFTITGKVL